MELEQKKRSLESRVDDFIVEWDSFIIDYWWRKKYNVAFGSAAHREMNFIDMLIEFQETVTMNKVQKENLKSNESGEYEGMTQSEIDKDFDDLDLSEFDN